MLVNQTGPQDYPAVSPDGTQVAYMSSIATLVPGHGATITQQLWIVSLQLGKPRQLFHGSSQDTSPAWSPDGKQIAFSSNRSGPVEIWVADADGRSAKMSNYPLRPRKRQRTRRIDFTKRIRIVKAMARPELPFSPYRLSARETLVSVFCGSAISAGGGRDTAA
jgi:Tol biopolymer transport system component